MHDKNSTFVLQDQMLGQRWEGVRASGQTPTRAPPARGNTRAEGCTASQKQVVTERILDSSNLRSVSSAVLGECRRKAVAIDVC
jgi:hypothetical protein